MLINFIVPCERIPSVNELYGHNWKTGAVYKKPEIVRVFDQMRTFMSDHYPISNFANLTRQSKLEMHYDFVVRRNIGKRDLSNMLKMVEDTVTKYLGVDDSQVLFIRARKSENQANTREYVNVTISDQPRMTDVIIDRPPIVIPTDYLFSVNNMYGYNRKSRTVFKRPETVLAEQRIRKFLSAEVNLREYQWVNNKNKFKCHYDLFFNKNSDKRDVSNVIKSIEDAIFKFFSTDDSRVNEISARKFEVPSNSKEYIAFTIDKSNYDTTSFNNI